MLSLLIVTVSITITVSFFCSLFEACLLSVSLTDIARIQDGHPRAARILLGFKKNIDKPIAAILIINTLANTIGASLSGAMFDKLYGSSWIAVFSIVYSLLMLQWTEILPKTLGVRYNKTLASVSAFPLKILQRIFSPLVFIVHAFNRPFSGKKRTEEKLDAVGEISVLAHFAQSNAEISKNQERILTQALKLTHMSVKDIMEKRAEIKTLSTAMSLAEALIEAHLHHHTRFPLAEDGDLDRILGYVNFKDIVTALRVNPADPSLRGIARPILRLRGDESISTALARLTSSSQHIALVEDAERGLVGLVTLENIIECLVGDLNDEYDILPEHLTKISETRCIVGGGIKAAELGKMLGVDFGSEAQVLSEGLLAAFGRVPEMDERIVIGNIEFTVRKIRRGKIYEVSADRMPAAKADAQNLKPT